MPRYIYTDRLAGPVIDMVQASIMSRQPGRPFPVHTGIKIFECEASDILEADALLLKATGRIAGKEPSVCCEIF